MDNTLSDVVRRPPVIARHGIRGGCDWWWGGGYIAVSYSVFIQELRYKIQIQNSKQEMDVHACEVIELYSRSVYETREQMDLQGRYSVQGLRRREGKRKERETRIQPSGSCRYSLYGVLWTIRME